MINYDKNALETAINFSKDSNIQKRIEEKRAEEYEKKNYRSLAEGIVKNILDEVVNDSRLVELANQTNEPISLFNTDGQVGEKWTTYCLSKERKIISVKNNGFTKFPPEIEDIDKIVRYYFECMQAKPKIVELKSKLEKEITENIDESVQQYLVEIHALSKQ